MKNIQVIHDAVNCNYEIYSISDRAFKLIFPDRGQDIEFVEDFFRRLGRKRAGAVYTTLWKRRLNKPEVMGIHGTLFVSLPEKREVYPRKREEDLDSIRYIGGKFVLTDDPNAKGGLCRPMAKTKKSKK